MTRPLKPNPLMMVKVVTCQGSYYVILLECPLNTKLITYSGLILYDHKTTYSVYILLILPFLHMSYIKLR